MNLFKFNVVKAEKLNEMRERLLSLLPIVRLNAVALVDSFGMLDSNLCSTLGSYDGNVYERLFEFAQNSLFNEKEVHDVYDKYLKPYAQRYKQKQQTTTKSKL
jgi:hypothetical protein